MRLLPIGALCLLSVRVSAQVPARAGTGSAGIGAGIHTGSLGGAGSNGFTVAAMLWHRATSTVAGRVDVAYSYNANGGGWTCIEFVRCPLGSPPHFFTVGTSVMVGELTAMTTEPYFLGGLELQRVGGHHGWQDRSKVLPKLGFGILSRSGFIELTYRWRSDWEGWSASQLVLLFGVHRTLPEALMRPADSHEVGRSVLRGDRARQ